MGVRSLLVQLSQIESHRATTRFAGMAAIAATAQLVSVEPWISGRGGHALWMPGAALMCALLWRPYREWLACFAGALLGCIGVLALRGATAAETSSLILGLLILVTAATLLIRQFGLLDVVRVDFPQVATFWVIAVLALPLTSTGSAIGEAQGNIHAIHNSSSDANARNACNGGNNRLALPRRCMRTKAMKVGTISR